MFVLAFLVLFCFVLFLGCFGCKNYKMEGVVVVERKIVVNHSTLCWPVSSSRKIEQQPFFVAVVTTGSGVSFVVSCACAPAVLPPLGSCLLPLNACSHFALFLVKTF